MARIRTIKPEFPHSESMGKVSRDARLCFIMLWTLADDYGRLRGTSRMLASLLFPYDDDAPKLIDKWLSQLEREKCVVRYVVEDANYVQVLNWSSHQKVDKPSASKIPEMTDSSRLLANIREGSPLDQGPRTKEEDQGPRTGSAGGSGVFPMRHIEIPSPWAQWAKTDRGWDAGTVADVWIQFREYWATGKGKGTKREDWEATFRNWCRKENFKPSGGSNANRNSNPQSTTGWRSKQLAGILAAGDPRGDAQSGTGGDDGAGQRGGGREASGTPAPSPFALITSEA